MLHTCHIWDNVIKVQCPCCPMSSCNIKFVSSILHYMFWCKVQILKLLGAHCILFFRGQVNTSRVQSSFKSFQSTLINYWFYWLWFKIIDFIDYDFINFVRYSECYTSLHESVPIASEHLRCLATCFKQDGGQNKHEMSR